MSAVVITFYKFVMIREPLQLQADFAAFCKVRGMRGTVLIAGEGINATVSGSAEDIAALVRWLRSDSRFEDLVVKESHAEGHPFKRLKVKVKREIVTFGQENVDAESGAGTYVAPEDWNALIKSPDVVVIDTRNNYEYGIGTFKGAMNPETQSFSEFPAFVKETLDPGRHKKIAMFCTGGIRCEKATAYMRAQGFENVFHLEGGILKYLEVVPKEDSLWQGECFIFDGRVAVAHGVRQGCHELCSSCGHPIAVAQAGERSRCPGCQARAGREGANDTHSGR